MNKLIGKKLSMSQIFAEDGKVTPVTSIKVTDGDLEAVEVGTPVKVTGVSKGRGFAGTIKRWGFHRQSKTHGQSDRERAPGSIGAGTDPGRVLKGKKMAGRMGNQRVTVWGVRLVEIDKESSIVKVLGAVPGARNGRVEIVAQRSKIKDQIQNL